MRRALRHLVNIVTQHMRFGEEDLCERFLFLVGAKIQPLECAIDVAKSEKAIWVPITQSLRGKLVGDDSRNKRRAALDDIVLRFPPLQPILGNRRDERRVSFSKNWRSNVLL